MHLLFFILVPQIALVAYFYHRRKKTGTNSSKTVDTSLPDIGDTLYSLADKTIIMARKGLDRLKKNKEQKEIKQEEVLLSDIEKWKQQSKTKYQKFTGSIDEEQVARFFLPNYLRLIGMNDLESKVIYPLVSTQVPEASRLYVYLSFCLPDSHEYDIDLELESIEYNICMRRNDNHIVLSGRAINNFIPMTEPLEDIKEATKEDVPIERTDMFRKTLERFYEAYLQYNGIDELTKGKDYPDLKIQLTENSELYNFYKEKLKLMNEMIVDEKVEDIKLYLTISIDEASRIFLTGSARRYITMRDNDINDDLEIFL